MGALQWTIWQHQNWRLVTCPWLHAGVIHLVVNLPSITLVGIHLEQDFGPVRTGIIYLLSAVSGSVASAVFVQHSPVVVSSSALFGLLGATLAGLIRYWHIYSFKFRALLLLGFVAVINFFVGFWPHVDNFSNIGGFLSGLLLGFVLLYNPHLFQLEQKKGLFDCDLNRSVKLREKLDKPASRIAALLFFIIILAAGILAVVHGFNASEHCAWCRYISCIPTNLWSCNEKAASCEAVVSDGRLTLTCMNGSDKFQTFPFGNISQDRMDDLCTLMCS